MTSRPEALDPTNPFAAPSELPYGLPDFAQIRPEHFLPAIRAGIAAERAEVEAVAANPEPATIENTVEALERSGELLGRTLTVLYNQLSSDTSPELEQIEEQITDELSAHHDFVAMEPRLYARNTALLEQVREGRLEVDGATRHLLEETDRDFRRAGVGLDAQAQDELRALNSRILGLEAKFGRVLLAATNDAAVHVEDAAELAGLPADALASAAQAAGDRGLTGYLLELQLPTQQGVLASLDSAALRARVHAASVERGAHPGEHDTRATLLELASLRARKAELLGYEHFAAYVAEDSTARTTAAVTDMLSTLAPKAAANARREGQDLQELAQAQGSDAPITAADWSYYTERLRNERFALDDAALRPYLELDRVLTHGVFAAATALYGLTFTPRPDLRGYHPDVRVWEVFDADGTALGLFLGDYFTRESKRGGAWMNNLVDQSHLLGDRAVVVNNLNIAKPAPGEPALMAWDEVITAFHEFGHALHGLLSDVRYPSQSGTEVPRDFVEYPSQVNEMWAWDPALLADYAVHHRTGKPIPARWIETLVASRQFNEGFATTEYLAAALLDQAWYLLAPQDVPSDPADVESFEARALAAAGVDLPLVPPRYRSTYFNHIFGGGYAAGYYSYIWSEVLDADTAAWFTENGGLRRENGDAFRYGVLAVGGSTDPVAAFTAMRGRAPRIEALLERRGLDA
ncbi:MAG: M3 family metallopeptidase [Cellulomonadaceae bacterium]